MLCYLLSYIIHEAQVQSYRWTVLEQPGCFCAALLSVSNAVDFFNVSFVDVVGAQSSGCASQPLLHWVLSQSPVLDTSQQGFLKIRLNVTGTVYGCSSTRVR